MVQPPDEGSDLFEHALKNFGPLGGGLILMLFAERSRGKTTERIGGSIVDTIVRDGFAAARPLIRQFVATLGDGFRGAIPVALDMLHQENARSGRPPFVAALHAFATVAIVYAENADGTPWNEKKFLYSFAIVMKQEPLEILTMYVETQKLGVFLPFALAIRKSPEQIVQLVQNSEAGGAGLALWMPESLLLWVPSECLPPEDRDLLHALLSSMGGGIVPKYEEPPAGAIANLDAWRRFAKALSPVEWLTRKQAACVVAAGRAAAGGVAAGGVVAGGVAAGGVAAGGVAARAPPDDAACRPVRSPRIDAVCQRVQPANALLTLDDMDAPSP